MGRDPSPAFERAQDGKPADPADLPPGVESDVALFRAFNEPVRPFDEQAARAMLEPALRGPPTLARRPTITGPCGSTDGWLPSWMTRNRSRWKTRDEASLLSPVVERVVDTEPSGF